VSRVRDAVAARVVRAVPGAGVQVTTDDVYAAIGPVVEAGMARLPEIIRLAAVKAARPGDRITWPSATGEMFVYICREDGEWEKVQ